MSRRLAIGAMAAALVLASPHSGMAANYGLLRVHVVGGLAEQPLAGIEVSVSSEGALGLRHSTSDARGDLRFPGLPPGEYRVSAGGKDVPVIERTVRVLQDQTTMLRIELSRIVNSGSAEESITVEGRALPVDLRSAIVASHLDLQQAQSLPVSRDYRGYVQLVPGVNVVANSVGLEIAREPSAKAGNNYQDRGAVPGSQTNTYYLDGLNITGMASGTGDLAFDNEAIQEQEVITSGVPPELGGGAGYVANVVSKSGGARYSGSANLFVQNDWMVEPFETADSRLRPALQDRYDGGLTFGGPAIRDRLWFFLAGQLRNKSSNTDLSATASPVPESVEFRERRSDLFSKLTFAPTEKDTVVAQFYTDPLRTTGTSDVNSPTNRFNKVENRPATGELTGQHLAGSSLFLEARVGSSTQPIVTSAEHPELGPANTVLFLPGDPAPAYERLLGSSGTHGSTTLRKLQAEASATGFVVAHGDHTLKLGYQHERWQEEVKNESGFGFTLTSLAPSLSGITLAEARDLNFLPASEYDTILRALLAAPASAAFRSADANGDGIVSPNEFAALTLRSRTGNLGGVNFLRARDVRVGGANVEMRSHAAYGQETWHSGRFTVQAGIRTELRAYLASDGSTIETMDAAWLPRLGLTFAPGGLGDRSQRLSLTYGEYANPLRTSMVRYAGNVTGSVSADEIWLGDDWFDYRTRGSISRHRDAAFAPNLENEVEHELALTYAVTLSPTLSALAQLYDRRDDHLIEDYDPSVYFNPAVAGALTLTPAQFGYGPTGPTDVNYFLGNLVGAHRRTDGLDLALERRFTGRWSASWQYSYKHSKGNSNSQGAADLQGDFLELDPRQPYMTGWIPGTIEHQLKAFGVYRTPIRLEIGALAYWNSGARYTEADIFRPTGSDIYYNHRLPDGTYVQSGTKKQPSCATLDLRLRYPIALSRRFESNFFVDVYNALNSQSAIRVEPGYGDPAFQYGEPRELLLPRRWEAGVRVGW